MTKENRQTDTCPTCGRLLNYHNKHVRFRLPDPVLALEDWQDTERTWMTDPDRTSP